MVKSKFHWISIIYRPPYSNRHPVPTSTFIDEFPEFLWVSVWPHFPIEWLYHIKRPNTVKTTLVVKNLKKINWAQFARNLNQEINKNIYDGQSLQELYDGFISSIKTTLDMHAPKRECSKTVRSDHPWFDHDAKRLKLQWRLAEKCWLKSQNNADRTHYMHINICFLKTPIPIKEVLHQLKTRI